MIESVLSYSFFQNAFFAGVVLGIVLPIIGLLVLLRKMPFIADALGHMNMSAIAFLFLLNTMFTLTMFSSLFIVITWSVLGGVLVEYISGKYKYYKEVSIMIVYSVAISLTMIFLSLSHGFNDSFFNILFGNINAISDVEVVLLIITTIIVLTILLLNYRKIIIISIDEELSKLYGVNLIRQRYLTIILISVVITFAIKIIGVLLVSSLILIPNLAAMRLSNSLKSSVITSILITEVSIVFGIIISYYLNLPSSAIIVLLTVAFYLFTIVQQMIFKKGQ